MQQAVVWPNYPNHNSNVAPPPFLLPPPPPSIQVLGDIGGARLVLTENKRKQQSTLPIVKIETECNNSPTAIISKYIRSDRWDTLHVVNSKNSSLRARYMYKRANVGITRNIHTFFQSLVASESSKTALQTMTSMTGALVPDAALVTTLHYYPPTPALVQISQTEPTTHCRSQVGTRHLSPGFEQPRTCVEERYARANYCAFDRPAGRPVQYLCR